MTNYPIEICGGNLKYCEILKKGKSYFESNASHGEQDESYNSWMDYQVVKMCGKIVPLKKVALPTIKKLSPGFLIFKEEIKYYTAISQQAYDRVCKNKPTTDVK